MAVLALEGIAKSWGAVEAVKGIDLEIATGEVVAICGDNGAGKSTLVKIMSGAERPTRGAIRLRGEPVAFLSPHDALAAGVATIYQDLALAPRLAIYQNVFMGAERTIPLVPGLPFPRVLDRRGMIEASRGYLRRLKSSLSDMTAPVETLSGGQRQAVAISRALCWNADVVIMDEPTAALGVAETAKVLDLVRALEADGKTVILVSHSMADVVAVARRVVVMKTGRKVVDRPVDGLTADDLGHMVMTGRDERLPRPVVAGAGNLERAAPS